MKAELPFALMERIGRVGQLRKQKTNRGGVTALDHFFATEKDFADRVGDTLDRQLFVERANERGKRVVGANDFLTFYHDGSR